MGKQRLVTIYQVVSLLGVLSIATSEDSFLFDDIDYGSLYSSNLKEKCLDYPEFRPCHYWKTFVEKASDGDEFLKNQDNCTAQAKDCSKDSTYPEILLEVPYPGPERFLDKRFTVFRRKNPYAQGYKRGPGFRSWGGKRSRPFSEKRTKFTSWGGKRDGPWDNSLIPALEDGEPEEKRTKFGNWGGKRDGFEIQDKRTKFRSWGGKRSEDVVEELSKREVETSIPNDQMEAKYWRSDKGLYPNEQFKKHVPKRPQFQSWGGKRTLAPWDDPLSFYYPRQFRFPKFFDRNEKRKFSSWGGKRMGSEGTLGKRFGLNVDAEKIQSKFKTPQVFQNWGGKRGSREEQEDAGHVFEDLELGPEASNGERKKRQNPEKFARANFNSWGGKREEGKGTGEGEGERSRR